MSDHSSKEFYRLCQKDYKTKEEARAQRRDCTAIDGRMNESNV
jgi:hypothetical protein